jgi:hypothetical protein
MSATTAKRMGFPHLSAASAGLCVAFSALNLALAVARAIQNDSGCFINVVAAGILGAAAGVEIVVTIQRMKG